MEAPKDHVPATPAQADSVNVLFSKSVWMPIASGIVSNVALKAQPYFEITPVMADSISALLTALVIIFVRRITNRPAHFVKPKTEE